MWLFYLLLKHTKIYFKNFSLFWCHLNVFEYASFSDLSHTLKDFLEDLLGSLLKSSEVFWNLMKSSEILWSLPKSSEAKVKSSEVFWNLTKSFEVFWNLTKSSEIFWIFLSLKWNRSLSMSRNGLKIQL